METIGFCLASAGLLDVTLSARRARLPRAGRAAADASARCAARVYGGDLRYQALARDHARDAIRSITA